MKKTEDQQLVIFGASGDLTERKLIPALFDVFCGGFLPKKFAITGVGRTEFSDESYRKKVVFNNENVLKKDKSGEKLKTFANKVHYHAMDTKAIESYEELHQRLNEIDESIGCSGNYIFYLATPPSLYSTITSGLAETGLNKHDSHWRRLIIEKPFGYDLASAKELNQHILNDFDEEQIYRIDHYLGKETVQNMFVTRFANTIFEPLWNRNHIHRVEITAAESVGVEKRGGYYDSAGALRDMVQNHLFQLVALVAMEPPVRADAESIRNEKLKVFQSLRHYTKETIAQDVIRGQYLSSNIRGKQLQGYREEKGVNEESKTETYVGMKFFIDNWRWAGVPFYIRTGKRMPTRVTEVVIHFKPNHHHLFTNDKALSNPQNTLVLRIQPNEGILLKFDMKIPGAGFNTETVNMDFHYDELSDVYVPGAYERLILDCMQGDATLYARGDSTEAAWEFIDPILKAWEEDQVPIYGYPAGTWGPENADNLIEGDKMTWRYPCSNLTNDGNFCEL